MPPLLLPRSRADREPERRGRRHAAWRPLRLRRRAVAGRRWVLGRDAGGEIRVGGVQRRVRRSRGSHGATGITEAARRKPQCDKRGRGRRLQAERSAWRMRDGGHTAGEWGAACARRRGRRRCARPRPLCCCMLRPCSEIDVTMLDTPNRNCVSAARAPAAGGRAGARTRRPLTNPIIVGLVIVACPPAGPRFARREQPLQCP